MKRIFALLSISTLLFQVLPVEIGLAQTAPQVQQIDRGNYDEAQMYQDRGMGILDTGGDPKDAIAEFDRAIETFPKDPNTYYGRGLAKFKLKDKQGAINDVTTATELYRLYPQLGSKNQYQKWLKLIEEWKASLTADKK
jgi:tetratricopeptide (TPR) repeat protein